VAKAAAKKTATVSAPLRAIPVISPQFAKLNLSGNEYQHWVIRLPEGAIADDLKEPPLFKQLQQSPKALRKHDSVRLVEYDESWVAEAIVADANATEVVLAGVRIVQLPQRIKPLFEDDRFKVEWRGTGYVVIRKSDGAKMSDFFPTEQLAIRAVGSQYPARMG
jgi:hypothetical protein